MGAKFISFIRCDTGMPLGSNHYLRALKKQANKKFCSFEIHTWKHSFLQEMFVGVITNQWEISN